MDRPLRRYYILPLLVLALLALPACSDDESQPTGALTPVDPPLLLRVEVTPPAEPTPPFTPVAVPVVLPTGNGEFQPTAGTAPLDPEQTPEWWQSYLAEGGSRPTAEPELNAPMRETPALAPSYSTPSYSSPPQGQPQRVPATAAPRRDTPPAPPVFERLPAVPQYSPQDRTAAAPRQPMEVAMGSPPAMPANSQEAFTPPAASRPPLAEVELGMPANASIEPPRAEAPSRGAQPILPNYSRPEYQSHERREPPVASPQVDMPLVPPQQQATTRPTTAPPAPPVASVVQAPAAQPAAARPTDPMLAVNMRADELIARGNSLAARGAHYSARTDLVQALRLVTQANDARLHTNIHSEALAAGLRALRESDDFVPQGSSVEADLNLAQIISVHRTPVLKNAPPASLTALGALQAYYTYAQEQFATAGAGNPSASRAYYSLARLHSLLAETKPAEGAVLGPKALALHQAALMTDPTNYRAANELGVLFARYGQYGQARTVLLHGLSIESSPELWGNLATVYERQGETQLSQRARQQSQQASQRPAPAIATEANPIEWVPADAFRGPPEGADAVAMPAGPPSGPRTATPAAPRSASESNSFTDWLPWQRSR